MQSKQFCFFNHETVIFFPRAWEGKAYFSRWPWCVNLLGLWLTLLARTLNRFLPNERLNAFDITTFFWLAIHCVWNVPVRQHDIYFERFEIILRYVHAICMLSDLVHRMITQIPDDQWSCSVNTCGNYRYFNSPTNIHGQNCQKSEKNTSWKFYLIWCLLHIFVCAVRENPSQSDS